MKFFVEHQVVQPYCMDDKYNLNLREHYSLLLESDVPDTKPLYIGEYKSKADAQKVAFEVYKRKESTLEFDVDEFSSM